MEEKPTQKVRYWEKEWLSAFFSPVLFSLKKAWAIVAFSLKQFKELLIALSWERLKKLHRLVGSLAMAIFVIFLGIGVFAVMVINKNAKKVVDRVHEIWRPQEEEVGQLIKARKRPKYYRMDEKTVIVQEVVLPVFLKQPYTHYPAGKQGESGTVIVDFSIVFSNRYPKAYFEEHRNINLIRDRLNTHIEPISANFPLGDEGKKIIREKVKKEVNLLIKNLNINGSVENVYIGRLLAV